MTVSDASDDRVLFEVEPEKRIATITLNNPKQRNSTTSHSTWRSPADFMKRWCPDAATSR